MTAAIQAGPVRYAVIGLGHISQAAVLPAFAHASENSKLAVMFSNDPAKRKKLGRKYKVPALPYGEFERVLAGGEVDAVYIALPNNLHAEFTERAARHGVHVLCEKPMATTEAECESMIRACAENNVKLMIAYRLHFEEANLKAIEIVQSGEIGEPKLFTGIFSFQVGQANIRLEKELGGGPLYDIGVYCINAARYLFRDEPTEVFAFATSGTDPRFAEIHEAYTALLRFPGDRLASFATSFGAASVSNYQIVGTKGDLRLSPAYNYKEALRHELTVTGKTKRTTFPRRDQFAAEIARFSQCILEDRAADPSGDEGLADVRIINAIDHSVRTGAPVKLAPYIVRRRPGTEQPPRLPPAQETGLVHAASPDQE